MQKMCPKTDCLGEGFLQIVLLKMDQCAFWGSFHILHTGILVHWRRGQIQEMVVGQWLSSWGD